VLLQYGIMPFIGWPLAWIYGLPTPLAAGLILVASRPGGTASNAIFCLAKADVPLSVTITRITAMLAIVATPLYTSFLAGSRVDVPAFGLFPTTLHVDKATTISPMPAPIPPPSITIPPATPLVIPAITSPDGDNTPRTK
jgi:hypothetical protein